MSFVQSFLQWSHILFEKKPGGLFADSYRTAWLAKVLKALPTNYV